VCVCVCVCVWGDNSRLKKKKIIDRMKKVRVPKLSNTTESPANHTVSVALELDTLLPISVADHTAGPCLTILPNVSGNTLSLVSLSVSHV
jgi:hypothetical protein